MHRRLLALTLLAAVAGCSLETSGNAEIEFLGDPDVGTDADGIDTSAPGTDTGPIADDTSVPDTSVIDSATPGDTTGADTAAADATPADTFVLDTAVLDTGMPPMDTGPFDTGPFDTGTPDARPSDTGADLGADTALAGLLTGAGAHLTTTTAAPQISLSTEGTLDWAHWGRAGAATFNHKNGANLISAGTLDGAIHYGEYPIYFNWTGGTAPTADLGAPGTNDGIYHQTAGKFITFDVNAVHQQTRTLKVYTAWNASTGTIDARLSDGSAAPWSMNIPPGVPSGLGIQIAVYTIQFRSASPGQKLTVKVASTGSYISLLAASLQ